MLQKYNRYTLVKIFLDSPTESFRLRELSRISKISPLSVKNYLDGFEKEGIITKYEKRKIPYYKAIRENNNFILYKKISIIYELNKNGLVDYLWDKLSPQAIILYGSYAKGEAIEDSDIDIFVIGQEKKIDIKEFEKKLEKNIHLMFDPNVGHIPKELKNNLVNGVILKGYFKVL